MRCGQYIDFRLVLNYLHPLIWDREIELFKIISIDVANQHKSF